MPLQHVKIGKHKITRREFTCRITLGIFQICRFIALSTVKNMLVHDGDDDNDDDLQPSNSTLTSSYCVQYEFSVSDLIHGNLFIAKSNLFLSLTLSLSLTLIFVRASNICHIKSTMRHMKCCCAKLIFCLCGMCARHSHIITRNFFFLINLT